MREISIPKLHKNMRPSIRPLRAQSWREVENLRIVTAWQGQRDSNPRPSVLETDALPTELYPYAVRRLLSQRADEIKSDLRN